MMAKTKRMTNIEVARFIAKNPVWNPNTDDLGEWMLAKIIGFPAPIVIWYDGGWINPNTGEPVLNQDGKPLEDKDIQAMMRCPRWADEYAEAGDSTEEQMKLFRAIEEDTDV